MYRIWRRRYFRHGHDPGNGEQYWHPLAEIYDTYGGARERIAVLERSTWLFRPGERRAPDYQAREEKGD